MTTDELFEKLAAFPPVAFPRFTLGQRVRVRFPDGTTRRGIVSSVQGYAVVKGGDEPSISATLWKYGVQLPTERDGQARGWQTVGAMPEDVVEADTDPDGVNALPARLAGGAP